MNEHNSTYQLYLFGIQHKCECVAVSFINFQLCKSFTKVNDPDAEREEFQFWKLIPTSKFSEWHRAAQILINNTNILDA